MSRLTPLLAQVVDSAVGLVGKGHEVVMYTSHHDPSHSFKETHDGTLTVKVYGDFLPRSILGRGHILCASVRGLYLSLAMLAVERPWDVIIVDQLSMPIPILLASGAKVIFYCHFPDLKLAAKGGILKSIYRLPFDWLEEATTLCAHKILVNSEFTKEVFHDTFRSAKESPGLKGEASLCLSGGGCQGMVKGLASGASLLGTVVSLVAQL